ncbi:MAG: cupin domain-containing protein [Candidatus Latescibacterota bacterium]|nr:cupin domain-containing protein [Candidatus Latescibacterota bacterium]
MLGPVTRSDFTQSEGFPWGAIRWLHNDSINEDAEQTFGLVFINPGEQNPVHYHPNCEEVLYVLSGKCTHTYDDEEYELGPGDSILVPQGVIHHAINKNWEPIRAIISFSSGNRQTVFQED